MVPKEEHGTETYMLCIIKCVADLGNNERKNQSKIYAGFDQTKTA